MHIHHTQGYRVRNVLCAVLGSGLLLLATLAPSSGCATSAGELAAAGGAGGGELPGCNGADMRCAGDMLIECNGSGQVVKREDCAAQGEVCTLFGCASCAPMGQTCEDGVARQCNDAGDAFTEFDCDPLQGLRCEPDGCKGPCSPASLPKGNVGCEFWPTVTRNGVWRDWFQFAVVVANEADEAANVVVHRGALQVAEAAVPARSARAITLPWVPQLKGADSSFVGDAFPPSESQLAVAAAYRLRSDQPVSAYQFSALRYEDPDGLANGCPEFNGGCFSYTNDASILLPSHALTSDYAATGLALTDETKTMQPLLAITATADDTEVDVRAGAALLGGPQLPALNAGETTTVTMQRGDVLQLFTSGNQQRSFAGTRITASPGKPVQVLSGVPSVSLPHGSCCADHLEEVVLPIETLGTRYIITMPRAQAISQQAPSEMARVRISGVHDGTTVTFDPPIMGATSLNAGEAIQLELDQQHVAISGDKPFSVTQYMLSSTVAGSGDPSQSVAIPIEQYRDRYVFIAPADYDLNRANVVAPPGAVILLDNQPLSAADFVPIGDSGQGVAIVELGDSDVHVIEGDQPFGINVYGYGAYTSYMYPGGMQLGRISTPPPR